VGVDAQRDRLRLAGAAQDGTAMRQQEGRRRRRVSARKHAASETAPGADVCRQQHALKTAAGVDVFRLQLDGAVRDPAA